MEVFDAIILILSFPLMALGIGYFIIQKKIQDEQIIIGAERSKYIILQSLLLTPILFSTQVAMLLWIGKDDVSHPVEILDKIHFSVILIMGIANFLPGIVRALLIRDLLPDLISNPSHFGHIILKVTMPMVVDIYNLIFTMLILLSTDFLTSEDPVVLTASKANTILTAAVIYSLLSVSVYFYHFIHAHFHDERFFWNTMPIFKNWEARTRKICQAQGREWDPVQSETSKMIVVFSVVHIPQVVGLLIGIQLLLSAGLM